jgi:DNA-binding NarL/FixJ family response regulator
MKLLLADDHDLVRDALKHFVERAAAGTQVLTAATLDEAIAITRDTLDLDIAVLDLYMPGMEGVGGLARLKALRPALPVVLMSGAARRCDIEQAMSQGASGYFPKTLSGRALIGAIELILAGERFMPVAARLGADGVASTLGKRETEVLRGLIEGRSNKEIARGLDLREVTVKLHVRGVFRKLAVKNRTQAVTRAMALGLP